MNITYAEAYKLSEKMMEKTSGTYAEIDEHF